MPNDKFVKIEKGEGETLKLSRYIGHPPSVEEAIYIPNDPANEGMTLPYIVEYFRKLGFEENPDPVAA